MYWPADKKILVGGKLIGLQLKKVEYVNKGSPNKDFGKLNWEFHNPKGPFELVIKHPEIFYCLPTFVNRSYKDQALDHCLFWRPKVRGKYEKNAWYNYAGAKSPHNAIGNTVRWGGIEQVINCQLGRRVGSVEAANDYLRTIREFMKSPTVIDKKDITEHENE